MKEIAAALMFFTRIPFYKLKAFNIDAKYFKDAINYWPVAGWVTGGVMVLVYYLSSFIFPTFVSVIFTILSRTLVTGALHEDGLADFFDGLGGGTTRERVLEIMKDSHIGTYGVLALICHFFLLFGLITSLPGELRLPIIFVADTASKLLASQISRFLEYARTAESSKSKFVYIPMSTNALITSLVAGLAPLGMLCYIYPQIILAIVLPILVFYLIITILKKRINGYTGDCCGAMFLLCELCFYMGIYISFALYSW